MKFIAVTALSAVLLVGGTACVNKSATSDQAATGPKVDGSQIKDSLKHPYLGDVKRDVDNVKKVVTLNGDVKSDSAKDQAEKIASSNAKGYVVANQIGVRPDNDASAKKVDSNTDDSIKSQWKALSAQNGWGDQHIDTNVKNGVLTLNGDVDTPGQRENVERSAANIAGVQQVVNKLNVKSASR
jgi:osmotically-inducible protein OsmY